jgi:ankyrin repeat protein
VANGHEAIVNKLLFEIGKVNPGLADVNGRTPLSQTVEGRSIAVVQLLLARGVEIDYKYCIVSESNSG